MSSWFKYIVYKLYYVIVAILLILFLNVAAAKVLSISFALLQKAAIGKYKALTIGILLAILFSIVVSIVVAILARKLRSKIFTGVTKPNTTPVLTNTGMCTCSAQDMRLGMLSVDVDNQVSIDLVNNANIRQLRITYGSTDKVISQCYCPITHCPICGGRLL